MASSPTNDAWARLSAALADRYRIERELGQGGMATVYLAHDLKHDRKVALKVLRPELAAILGGERFLAEIKTTANLQHPHILPLHDSGDAAGMVFYVMPYVEGETLRDRMMREKQLPVEDAVRIAREVADALAYAHLHGVVHRDIKPENILLHGGHAMVADFGIALAASRSDGGTRMTETGLSLGTPNYMSPEQAMGEREITPKVDIYALGCVLYEMLAGEPPFTGPTPQAVIARVMTEQPRSLTAQRHTVPPQLEAVIYKALEKLPADRFASAAAFNDALANPASAAVVSGTGMSTSSPSASHDWHRRAAMPAVIVALVMTALSAWAFLAPKPEAPVARYALALPSATTQMYNRQVAVAPDGSFIIYIGASPVGVYVAQLWFKARDHDAAVPLAGTTGAQSVAVSPDGRWIAFGTIGNKLMKLQIGGGTAIALADSMAGGVAPAWSDDGSIVYVGYNYRGLLRIAETGGAVTQVWPADSGTINDLAPLPGARGVLFSRCMLRGVITDCTNRQEWVLNLKSRVAREVVPDGIAARYLPTGHLLFVRSDGAGLVVPFNLRKLEPYGSPVAVIDSVAINANVVAELDASRAGTLVLFRGQAGLQAQYNLLWVDQTGRETPIDMGGPLQFTSLGNGGWMLSPDGKRLAIGLAGENGLDAIWVKELPSGPLSRVTMDSTPASRARWISNRELTYIANGGRGFEMRRVAADGTGDTKPLAHDKRPLYEGLMSPDGHWVVARTSGGIGRQGRDIIAFHGGDSTAIPLIANPSADEAAPTISPDGHWIAYESDETGRREVYVRMFPNVNAGKWQASTAGGMAPLWARNGRELYFVDAVRHMVAVSVAAGSEPNFGARRTLFTLSPDDYLDDNTYYTPFDIASDGRFIMARRIRSDAEAAPLIVVENWFTELRHKLKQQ